MKLSYLIMAIVVMSLYACGSGGGGGSEPDHRVKVWMTIENQASGKASYDNEQRQAMVVHPQNSILNTMDIPTPERMPALNMGDSAIVWVFVQNIGNSPLYDLRYEVGLESYNFVTRELWGCYIKWNHLDGTGALGISVWEELGGYFYNTQDPPVRDCPGTTPDPNWVCDPLEYDCANPWYGMRYFKPGDGLGKGNGTIDKLTHNKIYSSGSGYSTNSEEIRYNHLGYFNVTTSDGMLLDEKYYVYDVMP